ncbi:hypothetical protein [uncultured Shewanella sp.]|uniref:hypothetical protein n=1 Tax=uncultured Shewanella sp. TaxID=173975 RepID=UPI002613F35D|nr:hypothetical protein [uncultured Shewanella sp.]
MAKQWICAFFVLFLSVSAHAETFEQAYAPIGVGDITIIIPIDRQPAVPLSFSMMQTASNYLLAWDASSGHRFKLEHWVDGEWVLLSDNILTNQYQTSQNNGPQFRVSACDQYGCSDWKTVNNTVDGELMISRFSSSYHAVERGQRVSLAWNVSSAIELNITSNQGHRFKSYLKEGLQNFYINKITEFTLTATGFENTYQQTLTVSPAAVMPDFQTQAQPDTYTQPLLALVLDQNETMLPIERALLSITLTDGDNLHIIPQHDNKLSRVSDSGELIWTQALNGMVANQPILQLADAHQTEHLYFGVASLDGSGEICRIHIDGTDLQCLTTQPNSQTPLNSMIAGPVMVEERLFSFDIQGHLYEVSANFDVNWNNSGQSNISSYRYHAKVPLIDGDAVLTPPVADKVKNSLILRTQLDNVIALDIPESPSVIANALETFNINGLLHRAKNMLGLSESESVQIPELMSEKSDSLNKNITTPHTNNTINIKWTKALAQDEAR